MKPGAEFQQRRDPAFHPDAPSGRFHHARNQFEQRAFARAVVADDAHDLALADFQADAAERLEIVMLNTALHETDRILFEAADLFARHAVFDRDVFQANYDLCVISRLEAISRAVRYDFRFDKQAHPLSWKKTTSRRPASEGRRRLRRPRS
ncbi:MAG: hypothetical protein JMDDDDMK_00956 [Acidobacteria bacterium]|nr:hypothetical protein [Acidobacteriota bacterium]